MLHSSAILNDVLEVGTPEKKNKIGRLMVPSDSI